MGVFCLFYLAKNKIKMSNTFCWFMMVAREVPEQSLVHWSAAESCKKRHPAVNPLQTPGLIYTSSTINNDKKQPDSTLSLLHGHALPQVLEMIDLLSDKHFALGSICQPEGERMPHPHPQHNPKLCSRHTSIFIFSFFFFCSVQMEAFLELFQAEGF